MPTHQYYNRYNHNNLLNNIHSNYSMRESRENMGKTQGEEKNPEDKNDDFLLDKFQEQF